MNGHLTPPRPIVRVRRESRRSNMGQIQVIFGPMFSGKSTELIRRLQRFKIARYSCLIVKYANDKRYTKDASIATHDMQMLQAVNATKLNDLKDNFNIVDDYDVIGIDEGQFFPDVVEFSEAMANLGKTVIVAALDGTYQRKGFANILELVPLAEHVIKLTAVCMICFEDGSYTKRITEDKEIEVIGGAEKYMATCRRCYSAAVKIPCSPRPLGKCDNDKENSSKLSNVSEIKEHFKDNSAAQYNKRGYSCVHGTKELGTHAFVPLFDNDILSEAASKKPLFDITAHEDAA